MGVEDSSISPHEEHDVGEVGRHLVEEVKFRSMDAMHSEQESIEVQVAFVSS